MEIGIDFETLKTGALISKTRVIDVTLGRLRTIRAWGQGLGVRPERL